MAVLGMRSGPRRALAGAAVMALVAGTASTAGIIGQVTVAGLAPAAAAKPAGGGSIDGYVQGYEYGDCALQGADQRPYRAVGAGVRNSVNASSSRTFTNAANATVGNLQQRLDVAVAPTMKAGGLAVLDLYASGSISFWPSGTTASCGAASGSMVYGSSLTYVQTTQPVAGAGWLDLVGVSASPDPANFQLTVWNAAGAVTTFVPQREFAGRTSARVFLPAGGMVRLWASAGTGVTRKKPLTAYSTQTWSTSMRGVVIAAGSAVTGQRGTLSARRSVTLPAAISCAGSARIGLTRYAKKKKVKSVAIVVNGKTVRKVARLKVKNIGVKVPRRGTVTIKAKITPKHGKKRVTARTYIGCS